jgi:hypothetical protein
MTDFSGGGEKEGNAVLERGWFKHMRRWRERDEERGGKKRRDDEGLVFTFLK